jgi:hypothetical protein
MLIGPSSIFQCHGNYTDATDSDHQVPWLLGCNRLEARHFTIHTARPIRCEGRLFFVSVFSLQSIRDTVFSPRSFNNSAAGQAHPRSLPTTTNENTTVPTTCKSLPLNSLFLTFQTKPVASCYPKLASVRARPSLRRQTFHLDHRDSVQQAFSPSTPFVFDDCVVNKPSQHQHSKDRHLASLAPESTQPGQGILESRQTAYIPEVNLAAKSRTMRFSTLTAAALFAVASAQDAYPAASDSSLVTTWTMTRTVQRVVETVTATRNTSALTTSAADTTVVASYTTSSPPLGTASMGVYPQSNGTSSVLGPGASPSNSTPTAFPESGAERVGLEMVGLMAIVGLVGLVGL